MANNPNAPPALPPWFGPRTVLEEVERLVVNDNDNADAGWTLEQIKDSLMQTHQQNQHEPPPQGFDAALQATLDRLCDRCHLMVGEGDGAPPQQEPYRYTLSDTPPYLPPWFGPAAVLQAVGELDDDGNGNGSTWAQIRGSLMRKHQQPPPGFETLLRTMLAVLRRRGHLTWGASGPRHYTRRQAPAPVEPNPVHVLDYLWFYYLGYMLGAHEGLRRDSDIDEETDEEDALRGIASN